MAYNLTRLRLYNSKDETQSHQDLSLKLIVKLAEFGSKIECLKFKDTPNYFGLLTDLK